MSDVSFKVPESLRKKRWTIMIIMMIGQVASFAVPYLVRSYYTLFQESAGITHVQVGILMTIYGTGGIILYFPGGWIADKINPRILLLFSFVGSGILAFFMLFKPSFSAMILLYLAFSVTTILSLWAAQIKIIRSLGSREEQGKMFASREWLYGLFGMLIGFGAQAVGSRAGSQSVTFTTLIITYSVLAIVAGIAIYFLLGKDYDPNLGNDKQIDLSSIGVAARKKEVWFIAIVVFSCYLVYASVSYTSSYLQDVYGMSTELGNIFGTIRAYGIRAFLPFIFGALADKTGSAVRILLYAMIGMAACMLGFLVLPASAAMLMVAIIIMLLVTMIATGARALYYAQFAEANIPLYLTGIATGIVAVIAYAPDAFLYLLAGSWIDNYGVVGYTYLFTFVTVVLAVGFGAGMLLYKSIRKSKSAVEEIKSA
ncbi:MFS transporter [Alkalibacter mobilis]|uniref:MFS transporter n=1 Tax=Alkalibacter mobilis TaxID=2787712 RepID=UPI00189DC697|nr:MFS transporter [Alkalibacter mobilis]MBF7097883.1 MFS transporter [Alkalibacter mobilis]